MTQEEKVKAAIQARDGMDGDFGTDRSLSENVAQRQARDVKETTVNLWRDLTGSGNSENTKGKR